MKDRKGLLAKDLGCVVNPVPTPAANLGRKIPPWAATIF
jgi:hypothetical protein